VQKSASNFGLAMALVSGLTFGTSGSFASSLLIAGWSPGAVVTARVAIAALVLTLPALQVLRSRSITWSGARIVLLYGVLGVAAAQFCYFNAVAHLSVAVALLIEYSGILLVVAWGWIRGHPPGVLTIIAGAVALGGLVLVLNLSGPQHVDPVGVSWSIGAAFGLATYFVLTAESGETVSPLVMAWGGLAVGSLVLLAAGIAGTLPMHATASDVILLGRHTSWVVPVLGLALVAAVIAYVTGIISVRLLGAKLASFIGLTEVLAAVLFAWLLLGQRLEPIQLLGGALVITGIAMVRLDELRSSGASSPLPTSAAKVLPLHGGGGLDVERALVQQGVSHDD
jgi:drug/metabolite transporter (DMT)-like permease